MAGSELELRHWHGDHDDDEHRPSQGVRVEMKTMDCPIRIVSKASSGSLQPAQARPGMSALHFTLSPDVSARLD